MTTSNGHRVNSLGAQFVGNLLQVPSINTPQISGTLDRVEDAWG
jgi:hypothetical protein